MVKSSIVGLLNHLASTMGTTAKYLFSVEVKQGYIVAYQDFLWALVFLMLMVVSLVTMRRYFHKANAINIAKYGDQYNPWTDDGLDETQWMYYVGVICVGLSILFGIATVMNVSHGISHLLNPANYALQQVMNYISNA